MDPVKFLGLFEGSLVTVGDQLPHACFGCGIDRRPADRATGRFGGWSVACESSLGHGSQAALREQEESYRSIAAILSPQNRKSATRSRAKNFGVLGGFAESSFPNATTKARRYRFFFVFSCLRGPGSIHK
jgi:hypothetical protein